MTKLGSLAQRSNTWPNNILFSTLTSLSLNQTAFQQKTQRLKGAGVFQMVGPTLILDFYAYYMVALFCRVLHGLVLKIPKKWSVLAEAGNEIIILYILIIKPTFPFS